MIGPPTWRDGLRLDDATADAEEGDAAMWAQGSGGGGGGGEIRFEVRILDPPEDPRPDGRGVTRRRW